MKSLNQSSTSAAPLIISSPKSNDDNDTYERQQSLLDRLLSVISSSNNNNNNSGSQYRRNVSMSGLEVQRQNGASGKAMCLIGGSGKTAAAVSVDEDEISSSHHSTASSSTTASSSGNGAQSKFSKFGKRLRDSCRNLRGKSKHSASGDPEDYCTVKAPNDSNRSRHYVAMDFTNRVGRIIDHKDIKGYTSNLPADHPNAYVYFRRKVAPKEVEPLLTEAQQTIHQTQPWYHKGIGRDMAQRILATHAVDGAFLVRESSVSGGFVISYIHNNRTLHAQVLPDRETSMTDTEVGNRVFYSLDEGKTRFLDLLQMVEFYTLNRGTLNTRLTHYVVRKPLSEVEGAASRRSSGDSNDSGNGKRAESPLSRSNSSEVSIESQPQQQQQQPEKTDGNHNSRDSGNSSSSSSFGSDNSQQPTEPKSEHQ